MGRRSLTTHDSRLTTREDTEFQFLLEKIRRNKGVDFTLYRTGTLKRRIETRLRATGCSNYLNYLICLNRDPEEYDRLLDAVTINVTEFFRDPEVFEVLETTVIPEIIRRKETHGRRLIRVWSAGTANGEEAYSLAILFLEAIGQRTADRGRTNWTLNAGFDLKIYGTDIDRKCIAQAKAGVYEAERLKEIRPEILGCYFEKRQGRYEVKDELRAVTHFKVHNVVSDDPLRLMDLILCRNLVIYFTKPLQERTYSIFARSLTEGGFLVLGKVETLAGYPEAQFEVVDSREKIYRKREQGFLRDR